MAKKEIGIQITVIIMLLGFFYWLATTNFFVSYPQINLIIKAYKSYFIVFALALGLIPVTNLILQMRSQDKKEYDERLYYAILKGISHLILSTLIILILAVVFAYLYLYLGKFFRNLLVSFVISSIIIYVAYQIIWALIWKKWKLESFGFLSYTKKLI